jgi:actin-related protein
MYEEVQAIVIDNGTGYIKAGFAGDDKPSSVFSTTVGRPKNVFNYLDLPAGIDKNFFAGKEAHNRRAVLKLRRPIEYSFVTNWDDMEAIWHHVFYNELLVAPEEHPVLLTEAPLTPRANREKTVQIMFETFNTPAMKPRQTAELALYATGRTTGVVFDSGYEVTCVTPIYQGYSLLHAIQRLDIGGREIDNYLDKLISERGYNIHGSSYERSIVNNLKHKLCYVAEDFSQEKELVSDCEYVLPDGNIIHLGNERFSSTEILFDPYLIGMEMFGVDRMLHSSIMKCDASIRTELQGNIVLAGGSSMIPGLDHRLRKEVGLLTMTNVKILARDDRVNLSWLGGSILASMESFQAEWITKEEYDESGPSVVRRPCW